jgi:nitroreductase
MEVSQAVRERRSIRAFASDDDIPHETITAILDEARWAPSWANAQGWDVFVLRGAALARYKAMMAEKLAAESQPDPDLPMTQRGEWPEHIMARMMYRRVTPGAESQTPPPRTGLAEVYGAPCMLLFAVDERLAAEYACFDLGLLVENVCLAAHDRGLGTCIMAMAVRYGGALHELVPQAAGRRFVVGVALGAVDPAAAINNIRRERCALEDIVTFVD